ncbi:SRPBCC family protein [Sphingomonas sp.]|uniref:SRPBCC family protein n=1 Tax=Sphingomonas sp. TaxID=28214 RepID=UPI003AFF810E
MGRVEAALDREIEGAASAAWAHLTDWQGFPVRAALPGLESSILVGEATAVPRTRLLRFAGGMSVSEELFHQDDASRRYYCRTLADGSMPWRGYLASLVIDESGQGRCMVRLRAWCDAVDPGATDQIRSFIETSWADGIVAGLERLLRAPT